MEYKHCYDYIVVGAGPAGLQIGYYLEKDKRDYLILDKESIPGAFFTQYPRHGTLISINKVYTGSDDPETNLRFDWNSLLSDDDELLLKNYSKAYFPRSSDYVRYLKDYADRANLKIAYDIEVVNISKDQYFKIKARGGEVFCCKSLIVATGVPKSNIPTDIPNIDLAESYDVFSVDPEDNEHYYVITLEYGEGIHKIRDVFAIDRAHNLDATEAGRSQFLHPIIRRFSGTKEVSAIHIMEHLEANWTQPHHTEPLLEYLDEQVPQLLEKQL